MSIGHTRPDEDAKRVLVWHVHGSWTTSFLQGRHHYLIPVLSDHGPWGRGFAGRAWEDMAEQVRPDELADADVDAVVLQRPEEFDLASRWLQRSIGRDVPAVYVEHNAPRPFAAGSVHPMADTGLPIVHVTHFNEVMWDNGQARTTVIEHGVVDPGPLYTGALANGAAVINEPVRRQRVSGADLLPRFAAAAPVDVFGIATEGFAIAAAGEHPPAVRPRGDLTQDELHREMARRRVYLHTNRWTSLGMSLIEAMLLGMPVVALASTEAPMAVPAGAGAVSTDVTTLIGAYAELVHDPDAARHAGEVARRHALEHFSIDRFTDSWDGCIDRLCRHDAPVGTGGTR